MNCDGSSNFLILTFATSRSMIAASWMTRCLGNNCDRATSAMKRSSGNWRRCVPPWNRSCKGSRRFAAITRPSSMPRGWSAANAMRCGSAWRNWRRPIVGWSTCCGDAAANVAVESADQGRLNFGDEPVDPPSVQEQEIITAQAEADEARDQELLKRLEARRKARREKNNSRAAKSFRRASNGASGSSTFPKTRSRACSSSA